MATVMLIDGNSLTYRAFFALPTDLSTAAGQVTNAVFGFTSMLLNLVRDHRPDRVVVTFDLPETDVPPREGRDLQGQPRRSAGHPAPADGPGAPGRRHAGAARGDRARLRGRRRDRDAGRARPRGGRRRHHRHRRPRQLPAGRATRTSGCSTTSGASRTTSCTTRRASRTRTGVRPEQYVCYAALRGDPSDNLPGVPGVGEKTAAKLVNSYGDLDGIFAHVERADARSSARTWPSTRTRPAATSR